MTQKGNPILFVRSPSLQVWDFFCSNHPTVGTQALLDFDWEWKDDRVFALTDKGMFSLSSISLALTFLATHIILSGESYERALDLQPLSPVPQNEIDAILATFRSHKHLFQVSRRGMILAALFPGKNDFCTLFRAKVPVSVSS
jgi:hypothetical protein